MVLDSDDEGHVEYAAPAAPQEELTSSGGNNSNTDQVNAQQQQQQQQRQAYETDSESNVHVEYAKPPKVTERQATKEKPSRKHHRHSRAAAGRIDRYQIIKTLGEGSFGKVKLAYHLATHQKVALKIINRRTLAKSDMQGRVEREISYLRLLRHPHIIKLYDVIKSRDEIIMVMEFAGKELFDYIVQRGRMPEDEARRFFQQIISAVEYCHQHKIVHRDLKPENLLLDENLNVKIADFGLSNIMTDGNFLKTSCGSPNYAAPEVISGKLYAGPEVDVWSCGVILYVMLCGRLPFDDEFIPALFKKISGGIYSLPSYLSPGAKHLLQRMLVVNPLNRITVKEIMHDKWFAQDLPDYLLPPDEQQNEKDAIVIDDSVVGALGQTMGYDKEDVYEALREKNGNGSEIRDAYALMKDNRLHADKDELSQSLDSQRQTDKQRRGTTEVPTNLATPASDGAVNLSQRRHQPQPTLTFDNHHVFVSNSLSTPNTTIAVIPSSLPAYHLASLHDYGINPVEPASIGASSNKKASTRRSKTRWHFGIRSRSYPLDVMGEIYRALKGLGAEWMQAQDANPTTGTTDQDLWTILVRWKYLPINYDPKNPKCVLHGEQGRMMKMQIQLYQVEQSSYLVDFKFDGWADDDDDDNNNDKNRETNKSPSGEAKTQSKDTSEKSPNQGTEAGAEKENYNSCFPFLHMATRLIMELAVNSQTS